MKKFIQIIAFYRTIMKNRKKYLPNSIYSKDLSHTVTQNKNESKKIKRNIKNYEYINKFSTIKITYFR